MMQNESKLPDSAARARGECVFGSHRFALAILAGLIGAVLLGTIARGMIHHAPAYDELLHVLAARGMAEHGTPSIDHGEYERAQLFTRAVAASVRHHPDDELLAARLPALFAALALVALVGIWTTRKAGALAGVFAAILLVMSLHTVELAVFARFYTLHALVIFILFAALYELAGAIPGTDGQARTARRAPLPLLVNGLVALAALAVAWHLQPITIIAVGAIGAGLLTGIAAEQWPATRVFVRRHAWPMVGVAVATAVVGLFVLYRLDLFATFTQISGWASGSAQQPNFYNQALNNDMPLLWPLVPFAVLTVALRQPRLATTLAVAIVVALLVTSLAAQKAVRYLYYIEPFIAILLGCALATALFALRGLLKRQLPGHTRAASLLMLGVLGASLAASKEGIRTGRLLLGRDSPQEVLSYGKEADWTGALPQLQPHISAGDTVIASNAMKALYYLGHYDYELNASILGELEPAGEFGVDERTGRQVIGSWPSIEKLLRGDGAASSAAKPLLIVIENKKLGLEQGVPASVVAGIVQHCAALTLPTTAGLSAWTCPSRGPGRPQETG